MLLGCTPQINVTVGLDVCGCSTTSPGFLEPGEFGMTPGPLVPGVGAELGGFGTDPCPLAAPGATTIPPGEGLEIGPKVTPGTLSSAADPPPPPGEVVRSIPSSNTMELPKSQHCPKRDCFPSVHFWSLFSNLANESFAAAHVVVVVCRVDDGSVKSLSEYI